MSWFQSSNLASFAKTALKEAQKTIDKALEINEADEGSGGGGVGGGSGGAQVDRVAAVTEAATDFFASWGVAVGTKKSENASAETNGILSDKSSSAKPSYKKVVKSEPKGATAVLSSSNNDVVTSENSLHHHHHHQSVSHKRSASASNLESSSNSNKSSKQDDDNSTAVMHKSLTSDIPVTLIAGSPTDEGYGTRGSHQTHSRSLSDTVSSAWDDCENVLSLDEPDFSFKEAATTMTTISSKKAETDVLRNQETVCLNPESGSLIDAKSSSTGFLVDTTQSEDSSSKSTDTLVTSDLTLVDFSKDECDESLPIQNETDDKTGTTSTINLLEEPLSNLDLLSNIDLNSTNSFSSPVVPEIPDFSPLKDVELSVPCPDVSSSPSSVIHGSGQNAETKELIGEDHQTQSDLESRNENCDSSSWSWADQNSSGFVEVDSTTGSHIESNPTNNVTTEKEIATTQEDTVVETVELCESNQNSDLKKVPVVSDEEAVEINEKLISTETTTDEVTPKEDEVKCKSVDDESSNIIGPVEAEEPPKVSSPFPSSTVDSPRSISPHLEHPDSHRSTPDDHLEQPINNQPSVLHPCDSTNQNFLPHPDEGNNLNTFCSGSHSQPESSRSSSIVVIAGGDRASGVPSENSSRGSTGSQDANVHDIDDHSHASSGFERVESCDAVCHVSTSPIDRKGKHKKGASSASSSDIEVIPSDYSSNSGSSGGKRSSTYYSTSIGLQTTVYSKEIDTQTDFPDESKLRLEEELPKKMTLEISEMLAEKDQIIEQLREEGEKLSKKQHDMSQILKKLRTKEKEMENTIKSLKGEIAGKNLENERLMKTFVTKEGVEQSQKETINKLNSDKRALELKIEQMRSELEDSKENCATMKASVEEASIEILELKNAISITQRDSSELDNLTRQKSELLSRNETLQKEVEHLRSTINSTQSKASAREAALQSEITTLTEKVHTLEYRIADISSEVADATMPLSLEIEKLQEELRKSSSLLEKRDSSLQSMISEYEYKIRSTLEREKSFKDSNASLQSEIAKLESRIKELDSEKKDWIRESSLKVEQEVKNHQEKSAQFVGKLEAEVRRLVEEVERLSKENDQLGMELKNEKSSTEQERKRSQSLMDQMSHSRHVAPNHHSRNNSMTMNNGNGNTITTHKSISGEDSPSEHSVISENSYLDEAFDSSNSAFMMMNQNNRSMTPKSFFESFSSVGLIENLQSQLRQREAEVLQFQDEVMKNEKIRKSLNEEIAKLTMQNEEFQVEMEKLVELQEKLEETEKNYNALLQMYGEKVEEADELRMDLQDVKDMYKAQIETLLKK